MAISASKFKLKPLFTLTPCFNLHQFRPPCCPLIVADMLVIFSRYAESHLRTPPVNLPPSSVSPAVLWLGPITLTQGSPAVVGSGEFYVDASWVLSHLGMNESE